MPAGSRIRAKRGGAAPCRPGGKDSGGAAAKQGADSLWTVRAFLPSGGSPAGHRSERFVFRVAHRLAPLVGARLAGHLDGNVAEPAVPLGAVPVLDLRRDDDDSAGLQADRLFALLLVPALAGGADQQLPAARPGVVDVPVVPAPGLEGDIGQEQPVLRAGQGIEIGPAGKVPGKGVVGAPRPNTFCSSNAVLSMVFMQHTSQCFLMNAGRTVRPPRCGCSAAAHFRRVSCRFRS